MNAATGESSRERNLYWNGERYVMGKKAWKNDKNFQLTVLPSRDSDSSICTVQFSARAYSDNNLDPSNSDELIEHARQVESDLLALGVRFDVMRAKVTRADIVRNVQLSQPVPVFGPALVALGARKRVRKMDFGGTGFIVGNKSWEIGCYDKGAQMLEAGCLLETCPVNTLRPEVRLLKSRVVRDGVGGDNLPALRKNWPELKRCYLQFLERDVFKARPEANLDASMDFYALAQFVLESGSKRKYSAFMSDLGKFSLLAGMGLEGAKHFFSENLGYEPETEAGAKQLARIATDLTNFQFGLDMSEVTTRGTVVKKLYRELRGAVMDF